MKLILKGNINEVCDFLKRETLKNGTKTIKEYLKERESWQRNTERKMNEF